MNLLVVVSNYPHPGHRFSGIFNERSVNALRESGELVAVLAPVPYIPKALANLFRGKRWKAYTQAQVSQNRSNETLVYRAPYLQIPAVGSSFWQDVGSYLCSLRMARRLHGLYQFDAILSFGLNGSGGLAWRLGRKLRIPVAVWATGSDIRQRKGTAVYRSVSRSLRNADLVIYQSRELLEIGTGILESSGLSLLSGHHIVISRGIPSPPVMANDEVWQRQRSILGIDRDEILVLSLGRVTRAKGVFELLEAMRLAISRDAKIKCVIVGSKPGFDETAAVEQQLCHMTELRSRVRLLPACDPEKVWDYLCASDIFAFPSHNEGMPNSLLEAMVMGLPSIAFAIPAISEINNGGDVVVSVPPFHVEQFAEAILRLANSPDDRRTIGQMARNRVLERYMVRKNMAQALQHVRRIIADRTAKLPNSLAAANPS